MKCREDITGLTFNHLTALSYIGIVKGKTMWNCICLCGNFRNVHTVYLKSGAVKSCGCYIKSSRTFKYGIPINKMPEHISYYAMINRCYNKNSHKYPDYGGRGISVCEKWLNSYDDFLLDMGKRPSKIHTLGRYPDNNGNYEPSNCRWETPTQQGSNKRNSRILTYKGESMVMAEWARRFKTSASQIKDQLKSKTFNEVAEYYNDVSKRKPAFKLTFKQVKEIRSLYKTGSYKQLELANKYGVVATTISKIVNNQRRVS